MRNTDEVCADCDGAEDTEADFPYDVAVKSFMEVLLMGTMSSQARIWRKDPAPCPRCLEDDTVP